MVVNCYNWLTSNMFRPYSALIRLTTDGVFKFIASQARSIYHYKKLENTICCKPDDGRIRPKHAAS